MQFLILDLDNGFLGRALDAFETLEAFQIAI